LANATGRPASAGATSRTPSGSKSSIALTWRTTSIDHEIGVGWSANVSFMSATNDSSATSGPNVRVTRPCGKTGSGTATTAGSAHSQRLV
jgi:hypothetical protein